MTDLFLEIRIRRMRLDNILSLIMEFGSFYQCSGESPVWWQRLLNFYCVSLSLGVSANKCIIVTWLRRLDLVHCDNERE